MSHLEKMKPVNAVIAGCGGITPTALRGIQGATELKVVAVQDIEEEAAKKTAAMFDIPHHYVDYSKLLEEDAELVIVNTPNDCHLPMALEAFKAGKHCMVQKPIARNVREGEEMVRAGRDAGKLLGVVMLERSDPVFRQMRAMNHAGCFGTVTVMRAALGHTNHLKRPPDPNNWRYSPEKIGGGSFIQLAIHHVDIAQYILDQDIVEVTGLASSMVAPERFPADETTGAVVRFGDGAVGQFLSSFTTTMDTIEIQGTAGFISRDDLWLKWKTAELFGGELWDAGRVDEIHEITFTHVANRTAELLPQLEPHRLFAHAIRGKAPLEATGEVGLKSLKVVEAVRISAEEKRPVSIVQFEGDD